MLGETSSLSAALIWSASMTTFAVHGRGLPAEALNLFKNVVALVCFGVACVLVTPAWPATTGTWALLAVSGVIGISLGDTALFAALQRLGAQITSASQCLAPPIAAVIAAFAIGETLTASELLGMFVTVTAVAGVIHFGRRRGAALAELPGKTLALGIAYATLAAASQAVGLVLSRHAMQSTDALSGTIVRVAPAVVVLVVMTMSGPARANLQGTRVRGRRLAYLGLASFAGTFLGMLFMSIGVKYAKAGVAAALTSTYPIWIIPISRFVMKERINWQTLVCTAVAVLGIALLLVGDG